MWQIFKYQRWIHGSLVFNVCYNVPCIHQIQNTVLGTKLYVTQFFIFLCSYVLVLWHVVPNLPQMDEWNVNRFNSVLTWSGQGGLEEWWFSHRAREVVLWVKLIAFMLWMICASGHRLPSCNFCCYGMLHLLVGYTYLPWSVVCHFCLIWRHSAHGTEDIP